MYTEKGGEKHGRLAIRKGLTEKTENVRELSVKKKKFLENVTTLQGSLTVNQWINLATKVVLSIG